MGKDRICLIGLISLVLVSLSFVSAAGFAFSIVNDLPSTVYSGNTYSLKVKLNNTDTTYPEVNISFRGDDFSLPGDDTISSGVSKEYSLSLSVPSTAKNSISRTLYVDIYNGSSIIETKSVVFDASVYETSFCEDLGMSDGGDLEISEFDISNSGMGDDDEWELLDEIEIEVVVENKNKDDDVKDVNVEIKILDSDGNDVTDDFDLDDDKIDLGKINDDDEESATFVIPEVPVDIEEGDYYIYIVAYSDDDDSQCMSQSNDFKNFGKNSDSYAEVSVNKEYDRGIIIKGDLTKMDVTCGRTFEIPLELYNIGDEKEEKVLVHFLNYDLGIDEKVIIDDFRDGKKRDLVFRFDMPEGLTESSYQLDITTYFDWDDDEDELDLEAYDENSEDDLDEDYGIRLEVLSCGSVQNGYSGNEPLVNAELVSEQVSVGNDVIIKVMVTNLGDEDTDYILSLSGYSSWAKLIGVSPDVLSVSAGETEEAVITFNPTESGLQTFSVRVLGGGSDVSQDVSLNVEEAEGASFDFGFGGDNKVLYIVAIALVILIVFLIIIILVVSLRRR